jgi:hypothetical protein
MRLSLRVLLTVAGLVLFSVTASAFPRIWTLNNVRFGDGGTASGSFTYDATTNTYSNVNITTTAGTTIVTGANYTFVSAGLTPDATAVLFNVSNAADKTGTRGFALFFSPSLDNTLTVSDVTGQEATCGDATCSFPVPPQRFLVPGGSVSATAVAVPTLSYPMFGLLALALVAASFFLIRKL